MDQVISLYKEEIYTYQQQVEDLKQRNRDCDKKNAALLNKIQDLEDLIEKANDANRDLNLAFEHIHSENLRLKHDNQGALAISNQKQVVETANQKDQLAAESLVWISERDQFKHRNKFLERECERYHRDNIHLGKQVRHLLKTLEEERGMIIRRQAEVPQEDRITCAADVINKHLITFESIEELQQQNQKLLSLVKNLSAEQEEREVKVESEEARRLNIELEALKSQLDTIKNDRERVLNALNTIHKERDLFKILLCKTRQVEHLTPEIFQRMVAVACSSAPGITGTESSSAEREAHIEDLKRMISTLEQDLRGIRAELEDNRTTSADELRLKNELLEKAHIKISEVMKHLEVANERNELLESNIKVLTTEFDEIRTKHQKMSFELDEANRKCEQVENLNRELARSIDVERQRNREALLEVSKIKEQSDQIIEKQAALFHVKAMEQMELQLEMFNQKLADHPKDVAAEQRIKELEAELASLRQDLEAENSELQKKLTQTQQDMVRMQHLRNLERRRRIKLDRLLINSKDTQVTTVVQQQPTQPKEESTVAPIKLKRRNLA